MYQIIHKVAQRRYAINRRFQPADRNATQPLKSRSDDTLLTGG